MEETDRENYFTLNQKFTSFQEFKNKLEVFQRVSNTQFVISGSKPLQPGDVLRERFKYSGVTYSCKQGKQRHPSTARAKDSTDSGIKSRPNQRSYKVSYVIHLIVLSLAFAFVDLLHHKNLSLGHYNENRRL